jgi:hypothetical protein
MEKYRTGIGSKRNAKEKKRRSCAFIPVGLQYILQMYFNWKRFLYIIRSFFFVVVVV